MGGRLRSIVPAMALLVLVVPLALAATSTALFAQNDSPPRAEPRNETGQSEPSKSEPGKSEADQNKPGQGDSESAQQPPPQQQPDQAPPASPPIAPAAPAAQAPASTPLPAPPPASLPTNAPSVTVIGAQEARGILGNDVRSAANEDMGRIVDVIVDSEGRTRAAIIDFGGFLGVGSRRIAVDWKALHFVPAASKRYGIVLELTKDQVKLAPEVKEGKPIIVLGASGALEPLP